MTAIDGAELCRNGGGGIFFDALNGGGGGLLVGCDGSGFRGNDGGGIDVAGVEFEAPVAGGGVSSLVPANKSKS